MCDTAIHNCKIACKNELQRFKKKFRSCFLIPNSHSIDEILTKAKSPTKEEEVCYKKMKEVAKKYKAWSLNKTSSLKEDLKSKDIIDCSQIKEAKTTKNLNNLALNVCKNAKVKIRKKEESKRVKAEEQARIKERLKEERGQALLQENPRRLIKEQEAGPSNLSFTDNLQKRVKQSLDTDLKEDSASSEDKSSSFISSYQNLGVNTPKKSSSFKEESALLGAGALTGIVLEGEKDLSFNSKTSPLASTEESLFSNEDLSPKEQAKRDKLYEELISNQRDIILPPKPRGLLETITDKAKDISRKALDKTKDTLPGLNSKAEIIEKANEICKTKRKLVLLSQVVYQSVKAPQIERLDEEGIKPFNHYDLVIAKPAGVIVKIKRGHKITMEGLKFDKLINKFNLSLALSIDGKLHSDILCSKNLENQDVEHKPTSSPGDLLLAKQTEFEAKAEYCAINWQDIQNNHIYRFISLPTRIDEALGKKLGSAKIEILFQLKLKNDNKFAKDCESSKEFTVNMIEPKSFKILFTGVQAPFCGDTDSKGNPETAYKSATDEDIKKYFNSREVQKNFYDMFPVSKRVLHTPQISLIQAINHKPIKFLGSCKKGNDGVLEDAHYLSGMGFRRGFDLTFAVFDVTYTDYHGPDADFAGRAYTTFPKRYIWTPFGNMYLFSETRKGVGFLRAGEEEGGVFLHELGHILGQLKEHYPPTTSNQKQYYCSQFTEKHIRPIDSSTGIVCQDYRVVGGLFKEQDNIHSIHTLRTQTWKLLNNQTGIMHWLFRYSNSQIVPIKVNGILNRWIDRETYQKALATLKNDLVIPNDLRHRIKNEDDHNKPKLIQIKQKLNDLTNCHLKKRPVIKISGIYEKKGKNPLTNFSVEAQYLEDLKNPLPLANFSIVQKREETDHIIIQLSKNGKIEEEVFFPRKAYVENFYRGEPTQKKEIDKFPIFTSFFPACNFFFKGNDGYTISVTEVYKQNGVKKKNTLIKSMSVKWKEEIEI